MSVILLSIIIGIVVYAARAAKEGRTGARSLLAAMAFILFSILYEFFAEDLSITYFLINGWALDFAVLFIVQSTIVARRYKEAQQLEMGLLKSQIRPHFVHNALSTIISISRQDSERSRDLLVDFSSYLRGCYDYEGDDLISIEQELDFVRAYVALEQARFGDKYKVKYEIEVDDVLVPSLILQPLVENAFVHGLREKKDGGTVVVYVMRRKGNVVRIGVRDDGVGLAVTQEKTSKRQGIGLANIDRRLARIFKTQLVFKTPADGGCEVYMEIPYQKAGEDDEGGIGR
jgi:LytS/YehU family sensor histidine kinase